MCVVETPTRTEGYRHMLWRCERVAEVRKAAWLFSPEFDPEQLPDILACYGVPPALHLNPEEAM